VVGAVLVVAGLGAAGCSSGGDADATTTTSTTLPVTTTTTTVLEHTIVAGDTLNALAARYGVSVEALAEANGVTDPTKLQIGQVLRIPADGAPAAPTGDDADPESDGED
jgi:LysM repeat protein